MSLARISAVRGYPSVCLGGIRSLGLTPGNFPESHGHPKPRRHSPGRGSVDFGSKWVACSARARGEFQARKRGSGTICHANRFSEYAPRGLPGVLGGSDRLWCCRVVVPVQSGRLYFGVDSAVSILSVRGGDSPGGTHARIRHRPSPWIEPLHAFGRSCRRRTRLWAKLLWERCARSVRSALFRLTTSGAKIRVTHNCRRRSFGGGPTQPYPPWAGSRGNRISRGDRLRSTVSQWSGCPSLAT